MPISSFVQNRNSKTLQTLVNQNTAIEIIHANLMDQFYFLLYFIKCLCLYSKLVEHQHTMAQHGAIDSEVKWNPQYQDLNTLRQY